MTSQTIVVVGAGPAGLAALKAILDTPQFAAGLWTPIVYERRSDIGGVWLSADAEDPYVLPKTPMYDSLKTNLPHPLMSYKDFPFPPSTPAYPKAHVVHEYLLSFASYFNLREHITFNSPVLDISRSGATWRVTTPSSTTEAHLVIICNGHFASPRYPDLPSMTPGLKAWLNQGKASHSMWYRRSQAGTKILIVGAGPSGQDLCTDHLAAGYTVVHSTTEPPAASPADNPNLTRRPRVREYGSSGTVTFEDGTVESGIEQVLLATGYDYAFPFFRAHGDVPYKRSFPPPLPGVLPERIHNSGYSVFPLARHLWPLLSSPGTGTPSITPTLAFLGLPTHVSPLPLVQAQARAVLAAFASPHTLLNTAHELDLLQARYTALSSARPKAEDVYKVWHKFEPMEQYDYRESLGADFPLDGVADDAAVPLWHREMYAKKDVLRKAWRALEAAGGAEEWVRGVGEGEDAEAQWEAFLRRLLEKGERDQIS